MKFFFSSIKIFCNFKNHLCIVDPLRLHQKAVSLVGLAFASKTYYLQTYVDWDSSTSKNAIDC